MMSLLSNAKYNLGFGNNNGIGEDRPSKICRTSYLPDDCLNLIYKCLVANQDDCNSFGLTCRQWLHIQNNNQELLASCGRKKGRRTGLDESSPIGIDLSKLLTRFQHLKYLGLDYSPKLEMTSSVTSKPPLFESKVEHLRIYSCYAYSHKKFSFLFSWLPRLRCISLGTTHISDKGLQALGTCCSFLKDVTLSNCQSITDSGISFLLQNCRELHTLCIKSCNKISGIGFLDCPKTLTHVEASECYIQPEGIKAIASCGGLEYLSLLVPYEASINTEAVVKISKGCPSLKELIITDYGNVELEGWEAICRNCKSLESLDVRGYADLYEGSINTEAVVTISKGCPLLKELILRHCEDVKLEGWEAIGRNCKNLESLSVRKCFRLCDLGLQALRNGCNKLSKLSIDTTDRTFCSSAGLELFKRRKPQCHISFHSR